MSVMIDRELVLARMAALGLDMSSLAERAGLSRQAVYRILRDHQPFSRGVRALSAALGLSPLSLVSEDAGDPWQDVDRLVARAAQGEPRAFEVLPAALARAVSKRSRHRVTRPPLHHQLLAAAAEIAGEIAPAPRLRRRVTLHSAHVELGHAFFFTPHLLAPERLVADTPAAMKKHLVFGAFAHDDLARHFR